MKGACASGLSRATGAIVWLIAAHTSAVCASASTGTTQGPLGGFSPVSQTEAHGLVLADVASRRLVLHSDAGNDCALGSSKRESLDALPPPPNSLAMGLGALGCLGAIHLTRSMKRVSLGQLPDWYHAHAPAQIGHVRVFEFDTVNVEPVFAYIPPSTAAIERPWLDRWALPSPPFIPTRAARGPPAA